MKSEKLSHEISLSGPALIELLRAVMDKGLPFRFRAKGVSMSPFIKDGDVITVSPLFGALPRRGDVVAYTHPQTQRLVVHRIVAKKGDYFIVKGDNTSNTDDLILKANILGHVTRVKRNGKKIIIGLGPERFLIALLTRRGLLFPLLYPLKQVVGSIIRRLVI
jgi:signal peptidase I